MNEDMKRICAELEHIRTYFEAKADTCIGNGKMLLLNWANVARDAVELLKGQGTVSGWVSVKDRLPEEKQGRFEGEMESDFVLCYAESEGEAIIDIGYTVNGEWEYECGHINDTYVVTYWMPLPEPPKEG